MEAFPAANIFDPLRQFNPIEADRTVKGNATENATQQIDHFFNKVSSLLCQVNSLSWLHVVWEKYFYSIDSLLEIDRWMPVPSENTLRK